MCTQTGSNQFHHAWCNSKINIDQFNECITPTRVTVPYSTVHCVTQLCYGSTRNYNSYRMWANLSRMNIVQMPLLWLSHAPGVLSCKIYKIYMVTFLREESRPVAWRSQMLLNSLHVTGNVEKHCCSSPKGQLSTQTTHQSMKMQLNVKLMPRFRSYWHIVSWSIHSYIHLVPLQHDTT